MNRILPCLFFLLVSGIAAAAQLPLVKFLSTGGTIASRYDPEQKGIVPALSGEQLLEIIPEGKSIARVEVEGIANIGSSDMTPEIWLKLTRRANEVLAAPAVVGVVITHGTDTMEETAYFDR